MSGTPNGIAMGENSTAPQGRCSNQDLAYRAAASLQLLLQVPPPLQHMAISDRQLLDSLGQLPFAN